VYARTERGAIAGFKRAGTVAGSALEAMEAACVQENPGDFMRAGTATLAVFLATSVAGCASRSRSPDPAASVAAVRAAEAAGAAGVPRAAHHLKLARDQVKIAEQLTEESENEAAYLVFLRAEVDAKLALELARLEILRRASAEARLRVRRLQRSTSK
jgi:hypothetical protein